MSDSINAGNAGARRPSAARGAFVGRAAVLALGATLLSACDRHIVTSSIPEDYRQRHQIGLTRANETMEIFIGRTAKGLDHRQAEDVRGFGRDYMQTGEGPLVAYLPTGVDGRQVSAGLAGIRSALAGGGASGRLHIAHYHPESPAAAPIKLTFAKLKAGTATHCSYTDGDLLPTTWKASNSNSSAYNFGCAYQKNLAAQINDPRDLVRARQEGPIDVERRTTGIERIRENEAQELKPGGKSLKSLVTE
jgi:pilus assembly protein CpaD